MTLTGCDAGSVEARRVRNYAVMGSNFCVILHFDHLHLKAYSLPLHFIRKTKYLLSVLSPAYEFIAN